MGKGGGTTVGYWYRVAYHAGLGVGPIDAFLEMRGGDKTAWAGRLTSSGTITVNAPNLWGGEKDQGGIAGDVDVMFGEATQQPNPYLLATFGAQVPAWRGVATLVFKGGRYGAMNPYPQKPSYKFERIKAGWDNGCWYPETAAIPLGDGGPISLDGYFLVQGGSPITNQGATYGTVPETFIGSAHDIGKMCLDARNAHDGSTYTYQQSYVYALGSVWQIGATSVERGNTIGIAAVTVIPTCPVGSTTSFAEHGSGSPLGVTEPSVVCWAPHGILAMNPAHILYYARTQVDMGREPVANMNDASFRAAAAWYYQQSFGLCTEYDPANESLDDFTTRIEKVAGCSMSRSPVDGQWYIDIANGVFDLASLPILTDDDILDFSESPSTLDSATNSVSVQYFDPEQNETLSTAPVQAMAAIDAFGTIHDQTTYPEIPTSDLAIRVATRDLRASITPTRAFELTTTRLPYAWRVGTYFRLQSVKRGIADMVCILAEKSSGTLKSGAITVTASQDIYSLPTTTFVDTEHGVDTRPSQIPVAIVSQAAFEAPYVAVVSALSRADLAALPADVGYLMAVAADPATPPTSLGYTVVVSSGGDYAGTTHGDWCPSATVVAAAGYEDTSFTIANGYQLSLVAVGTAAQWGNEIVRVDAIDAAAGTIILGRACADTVPAQHAAGERLWFYGADVAAASSEYTSGETVDVKLLTNTGSQQLDESAATPMAVTFNGRQARPYPPAAVMLNGLDALGVPSLTGDIAVAFAFRNRVLQADQLIDYSMANVAPETGQTLSWRVLDPTSAVIASGSGVTANTFTVPAMTADGALTLEMWCVRDGLASWQSFVAAFAYGSGTAGERLTEDGDTRITEDGATRLLES